jgi:protein-disulfide isomerase
LQSPKTCAIIFSMEEKLTKDEKKAIRKLEWEKEAKKQKRDALIKKYAIWVGGLIVLVIAIIGTFWLVVTPTTPSNQPLKVAAVAKRDIAVGKKDAKVTLIEYSDFQCPACASYHPIVNQILSAYKDKILFVYRMFPLTNVHPNSHISAQAAYAASRQDKFFAMADLLFNKQTEWAGLQDPTTAFTDYAKMLNLNISKFKSDMNSKEAVDYVNASEKQALDEGLNATPTFILNGTKITNPDNFDGFKKLIDNELAQK